MIKWIERLFYGFLAISFVVLVVSAIGCFMYDHPDNRADILWRVAPSTVGIIGRDGFGSGTVIARPVGGPLVLTCAHVVEGNGDSQNFQVVFTADDGSERLYAAIVMKSDIDVDLALLWIPDPSNELVRVPVVPIARTEPWLYSKVYVTGSPLRAAHTSSEGIITSKSRMLGGPRAVWQVSAAFVAPGISGGTAVNTRGELVCVPEATVGRYVPVEPFGRVAVAFPQISFCIPYTTVREFVKGYPVR